MKDNLPIDLELPRLLAAIKAKDPVTGKHRYLLESPPGSGKSTRLAPALLAQFPGKVYLLQPRRSSTLMLARRIAEENAWKLGSEVGYVMRNERLVSPETRLIVSTHGSFLQHLANDQELGGVDAVLLDEFHERSLDIDLLTGMLCYLQNEVRADLKIIWMSATGAADELSTKLSAQLLRLEGRSFPVDVQYRPLPKKPRDFWPTLFQEAQLILNEMKRKEGRARGLIFLPGQREIRDFADSLARTLPPKEWSVRQLYGNLDLNQQREILSSTQDSEVILATNIAETSLTLQNLRFVIDCGFVKVVRFDEKAGREFLQLEANSADSATQRAGRSGRTAPGICFRLWSADEQRFRPQRMEPEIQRRDLSDAVLRVLEFGFSSPADFPWLEEPDPKSMKASLDRLELLGLVKREGKRVNIDSRVRKALRWPLDWRWALMLESGAELPDETFSTLIAMVALLSLGQLEGDLFENFESVFNRRSFAVRELMEDLQRRSGRKSLKIANAAQAETIKELRRAFLSVFPDFLARKRRESARSALLASGRGLEVPVDGPRSEYFLAIDLLLRPDQPESKLTAWLDLTREDLEELRAKHSQEHSWLDDSKGQFRFYREKRIFGLPLSEPELIRPTPEKELEILGDLLRGKWSPVLLENESYLTFIRRWKLCFPDREWNWENSDSFLRFYQEAAGKEALRMEHLRSCDMNPVFQSILTYEESKKLDQLAPTHYLLKKGRRARIEYTSDGGADLHVILQDLLGSTEHPTVGVERKPVRIHLLSPARRPIQVTNNLPGFWKSSYAEIRKELRGRYPKHRWPEDPFSPDDSS